MGYPREIVLQALEMMKDRRQKAETAAEKRKHTFEQTHPEFARIQQSISQSGMRAAQAVFASGDAKQALTQLMEENLQNKQKIEQLLQKEGLPSDYFSPHYSCKICSDTGYDGKVLCVCARTAARDLAFQKLNAKSPLALSDFDNFRLDYYSDEQDAARGITPRTRQSRILEFCREYAANFSLSSPNLLFIGATGLGKTHLSLAIAKQAIGAGFGVVYGSAQDLLHSIEREHFGKSDSGQDTLELILACDLLILDDLGTEFNSPFVQSTVYNIINSRMLEQKPTILNTNLSISEIRATYNERIVSRLVGSYVIQEFFGKDVRLKKRQENASKK